MCRTIVAILLVAVIAAVANAQLIGWRNCGSPLAHVHRIRVSGCSVTPCEFPVGTRIYVEVEATTMANSVNLPFAVTATVLGLPIPLLQGNACEHLTIGSCPALSGNSFTFFLEYQVSDRIPRGITTVINNILWNDFGEVGVCIQVDARIV